ncbi:MAG: SLC13 family permease [Deltaproteobacteria bacterium]|nr:MAG: SLC13 family permease [Deltaproteobacteria bacterium]
MDIWIVSTILIVAVYFLIMEKISVDLTAIGIIVLLVVFRILTPKEAVMGFANPAVITIGAMFIVSKGLMRTGGVAFIGRQLISLARGNYTLALIVVLFTVALASAFINNTPIVILAIPVVMTLCCEYGLSPAKFLIPISYASILAGTCTLIGTSTNIIVSDLSVAYGFGEISMFELASIGVPIAVIGIIFLVIATPKVIPSLANPVCHLGNSEHRQYLAELKIPLTSRLIGNRSEKIFGNRYKGMETLELIRDSRIYHPAREPMAVEGGDRLLIKAELSDLVTMLHQEDVELPGSNRELMLGAQKDASIVVELVITPHSSFKGQPLTTTELADDPEVNIIAVQRQSFHMTEKEIHDVILRTGDILLVWCSESKLAAIRGETDYLVVEDVYEELVHKRKAVWSVVNFIGMVGTATLGLADIMTCALTAAFLMIITGCLQMRVAYKSLQGDVLLLIAGTIALGTAMQKTGASAFYANGFINLFSGASPGMVLGAMILLTSVSTHILSNNATAVLLLPIALSTAMAIGVDPKPFIIGICLGASACFATPMGYQTNLMVYGPGGYRFIDYLKLGMPLNLLVIIVGTLFIPVIWPF